MNTHNTIKECNEFETVERVLGKLKIFESPQRLMPPDPDFGLIGMNTGIELTQPIRNQKYADIESKVFSIVSDARVKYIQNGGMLSVHIITVSGSQLRSMQKISRKEYNRIVERIVYRVSECHGDAFCNLDSDDVLSGIFKSADVFANDSQILWQPIKADFIDIDAGVIQNVIQNKSDKACNYKSRFESKWLIIHSTRGCCIGSLSRMDKFATAGKLTKCARETVYASAFDRVYYLDIFGDLTLLNCVKFE